MYWVKLKSNVSEIYSTDCGWIGITIGIEVNNCEC